MQNIHMLIIDPQNDFCDPNGSLFVDHANEDMDRLAQFIERNVNKISQIHVTIDCHHIADVSHPLLWVNSSGQHPAPLTMITLQDMKDGKWMGITPQMTAIWRDYLEQLEAVTVSSKPKYPHTIWPEHCLIGEWGSNVYEPIRVALRKWVETKPPRWIDFVSKGSNPKTEHFSAIQAEVPDPEDQSTQINTGLIQTLQDADKLIIAGEALSHCLANTVLDIATQFGDDSLLAKCVLLIDATSPVPVPIFVDGAKQFVADMQRRGMQTATTESLMAA